MCIKYNYNKGVKNSKIQLFTIEFSYYRLFSTIDNVDIEDSTLSWNIAKNVDYLSKLICLSKNYQNVGFNVSYLFSLQ